MIKLIKKSKGKCTCDVCQSKFTYEPEDILSEEAIESEIGILFKNKIYYIECPQCKKKNKIRREIIEIVKGK
jgi:hypothetical protein